MIENISRLIRQSKPDAEINIHAPIQGDKFPDIHNHDLIVLTGGPFDLLEDQKPSWVTETLEYIRTATTDRAERAKLLGICWGQQAIVLALGGSLRKLKRGPCVGVPCIYIHEKDRS